MLTTLLFDGFDALVSDNDLSSQLLNNTLMLHNPTSASITSGRRGVGQALKTHSGAYIEYPDPNTTSETRSVAIGAAFTYRNATANNVLIQASLMRWPKLSVNHDGNGTSAAGMMVVYVKNDALWVAAQNGFDSPIFNLKEDQSVYIEVRFFCGIYASETSAVYVNGQKVISLGSLGTGYLAKSLRVYLAHAPGKMDIDIDDLYIESWDGPIATKNFNVPILASGQVLALPATVESNSFSVTGSSADVALSDNQDTTFIYSDDNAELVLSVAPCTQKIIALQMVTRTKSDNHGVISCSFEDMNGQAIIATQNIAPLEYFSSSILSTTVATEITREKLKYGSRLKVRT